MSKKWALEGQRNFLYEGGRHEEKRDTMYRTQRRIELQEDTGRMVTRMLREDPGRHPALIKVSRIFVPSFIANSGLAINDTRVTNLCS